MVGDRLVLLVICHLLLNWSHLVLLLLMLLVLLLLAGIEVLDTLSQTHWLLLIGLLLLELLLTGSINS